MKVRSLSLREPDANLLSEPPIATFANEGLCLVSIASAWGFWGGLEGEGPVARAAFDALKGRAADPQPDWDAALEQAFGDATRALGELPWSEGAEELAPSSTLTCVVATPGGIWIRWSGALEVIRIRGGRHITGTQAHTLYNRARRESLEEADLVSKHMPAKTILTSYLDPQGRVPEGAEMTHWTALQPGEALVVTKNSLVERLRARLPEVPRRPDALLEYVLRLDEGRLNAAGRPVEPDRIGVVISREDRPMRLEF